jgi:hypothetical protein
MMQQHNLLCKYFIANTGLLGLFEYGRIIFGHIVYSGIRVGLRQDTDSVVEHTIN